MWMCCWKGSRVKLPYSSTCMRKVHVAAGNSCKALLSKEFQSLFGNSFSAEMWHWPLPEQPGYPLAYATNALVHLPRPQPRLILAVYYTYMYTMVQAHIRTHFPAYLNTLERSFNPDCLRWHNYSVWDSGHLSQAAQDPRHVLVLMPSWKAQEARCGRCGRNWHETMQVQRECDMSWF